jgi:hypothetical protein
MSDPLPPCRACKRAPVRGPGHFFCAVCYNTLYPDWQTEYVLERKGLSQKKVWVAYRLVGGVWKRLG